MKHFYKLAILPALCLSGKALAAAPSLTSSSSFVEAQELWQNAKDISSTDINGNWKRVAVIEHTSCKNVMHGSSYDLTGIKNHDGSVFSLSFEGHQVKFLNVGITDNTQGPYEINSSKTDFSSWAYDESTKDKDMTDQAYGSYNCKELEGSQEGGKTSGKQLICSVGTRLVKEAVSDPVFKACSKLKTGLIVLFNKVD